jgi:hypothetical protein
MSNRPLTSANRAAIIPPTPFVATTLMKTLNPQSMSAIDAGSAFCPCVWLMPCSETEARVR